MQLAGYRSRRRIRIPGWLTVVLAVLWVGLLLSSFVDYSEEVSEDGESLYLMYVDTELRLLEAGREESPFVQWLTGADREEEELAGLRDTMVRLEERTVLFDHGSACLAMLHAELGDEEEARRVLRDSAGENDFPSFRILQRFLEGEEPEPADVDLLREAIGSGANHAWEVRIFRYCDLDREIAAEDPAFYDANIYYNGIVLKRVLLEFAVWLGLVVCALLCLGPARAILRRGGGSHFGRVLKLWNPGTVLALFFCAWLAAGQGAVMLGTFFEVFEVDFERGPFAYAGNLLLQALPMVIMVAILLENPRHLLRIFVPKRSAAWRAVILSLGLLGVVSWVLYYLSRSLLTVDPTDFLEWVEPGALDLAYGYLAAVVFAPVAEEVLCRGFLFLGLRQRVGTTPALLLSSTVFAALHVQYDLFGLVSVFLFGVLTAVLAWRTNSILPGILLHALYNLALSLGVHWIYYTPL